MNILLALLLAVLMLSSACRSQAETEVAITPAIGERKPSFSITDTAGKTLIDASQIESYEWDSHTLTLRPGVRKDLHSVLAEKLCFSQPPLDTLGDVMPVGRRPDYATENPMWTGNHKLEQGNESVDLECKTQWRF